jgi:hypothetical protein
VGKELMRTKQLRGVDADLGKEICARNYELVKSGTLKVKIESKVDYKSRMGRSPDLADAAFLALDCARQRMGLVAVEPVEKAEGSGFRIPQRKTIKSLRGSLDNSEGSLS